MDVLWLGFIIWKHVSLAEVYALGLYAEMHGSRAHRLDRDAALGLFIPRCIARERKGSVEVQSYGLHAEVVPQGKLDWIAINFYAEPAMGMKLRYLQCDISVEESTLKEAYSRDQRQRWFIYLRQQDVELDVNRCRPVLEKVFELLR
ncbi:hypothetical protein BHE74_00043982 [Ensete ventricosum]|nr:hypothetical protein BHE74_00043982 [Ensete ventricosum]